MFHDSYFTEHPNQLPHLFTVQLKCKKQTLAFGVTEVFAVIADRYFNKKIVHSYLELPNWQLLKLEF